MLWRSIHAWGFVDFWGEAKYFLENMTIKEYCTVFLLVYLTIFSAFVIHNSCSRLRPYGSDLCSMAYQVKSFNIESQPVWICWFEFKHSNHQPAFNVEVYNNNNALHTLVFVYVCMGEGGGVDCGHNLKQTPNRNNLFLVRRNCKLWVAYCVRSFIRADRVSCGIMQ